jgi:predicted dehydrogenase
MKVLLIGTGFMAKEYAKVLKGLDVKFDVIGRGEKNVELFKKEFNVDANYGGLKSFLDGRNIKNEYSHVINSSSINSLKSTTICLLENGVENILLEKPAGLNIKEIETVANLTKDKNASVYVAYNRRFYASTLKAKDIIQKDGGVTSFNFEFTEWSHEIEKLETAPGVKENWFLANSTHVVDLAFYLGGMPEKISTYVSGGLDWHPSASIFSGAGISESGALFSYQANWESAGRWSVEMMTKEHRLIFRPMEKLQIQNRGSIQMDYVQEIDYSLDLQYKPGLYLQTEMFLKGIKRGLCHIFEQALITNYYRLINKG